MSPKWFILVIMTWITLAILGGFIEGAWLGSEETGTLNTLMNTPFVTGEGNLFIRFVQTVIDPTVWGAVVTIATFDFAMFVGTMGIFRWLFFLPLSIGFLFSLALSIRGTSAG